MKKEVGGPKKMMHIVVGTPDEDNCPICRAHVKGSGEQVDGGPLGPILVQELHCTRSSAVPARSACRPSRKGSGADQLYPLRMNL